MIFAMSVQQDLERVKCPEIITKGQTPPEAMLLLVKNWGMFFLISEKIIKGWMPSRAMLLRGHFSRIFKRESKPLCTIC